MSKRIVNVLNGLPIETRRVATLVKADYNPRTISNEQRQALEHSVEKFGLVEPIILNCSTGNIIGGHQRLDALIALGVEETDVVLVDLSPENEKVLNLALNKISGEWDWTKLTDLLGELREHFEAGDIADLTGFKETELSALLGELGATSGNKTIDEQKLAETAHECPKCGFKW